MAECRPRWLWDQVVNGSNTNVWYRSPSGCQGDSKIEKVDEQAVLSQLGFGALAALCRSQGSLG